MTTALEKTIKRALKIGSQNYVITLSPVGLKIVLKGKRNGLELKWDALVSGQAALAVALNASLGQLAESKGPKARTTLARRGRKKSA